MKKILLLPALFAGMLHAQYNNAASWQDVNSFTNSSNHGGVQATTDGTYQYVVGTFENSITFPTSPSTTTLNSGGDVDIYVAKYSSTGSCLAAVQLGDAVLDDKAYSITYQGSYVYIGCFIADEGHVMKLSPGNLATSVDKNLGAFVYPLSLNGYGIYGNVLVGGSFEDECYLPKSSGTIHLIASNKNATGWSSTWNDAFCGILDGNCNFTYAANPNNSTGENEIMSIWGRNGRIYCTGYFRNNMKWASSSSTVTAAGVQDAFVASAYISTSINQCSMNNDFLKAGSSESDPGGSASNDPYWRECGYGIVANGTAIYVTGNLMATGTCLFGTYTYTGAGAFVARIDYNGSNVGSTSWARCGYTCGTSTAAATSIGYGIAVDANGYVWSTGRAQYNVSFDGGSNSDVCVSSENGEPGYISKYDASGNILMADPINEISSSYTVGRGIVANGCSMYVTGWCATTGQFQTGALTAETVGSYKSSMFVVAFSRDANIQDDVSICTSCPLFPVSGTLTATGGTTYSWSPGTYLSSTTSATPTYSITTCTATVVNYSVTISTSVCTTTAQVTLETTLQPAANAGSDVAACPNTSYYIGSSSNTGFTYSWSPTTYLNNANISQPAFSTTTTAVLPITYTVTQTDICGNVTTDQVTVTASHSCRMANPDGTEQTAAVFPNPSSGIFTVNLTAEESASEVEFVVTDLTGRTVQQNTVTTSGGDITVDLSAEAKGVYMLSVTRNGVTEMHQLIIE